MASPHLRRPSALVVSWAPALEPGWGFARHGSEKCHAIPGGAAQLPEEELWPRSRASPAGGLRPGARPGERAAMTPPDDSARVSCWRGRVSAAGRGGVPEGAGRGSPAGGAGAPTCSCCDMWGGISPGTLRVTRKPSPRDQIRSGGAAPDPRAADPDPSPPPAPRAPTPVARTLAPEARAAGAASTALAASGVSSSQGTGWRLQPRSLTPPRAPLSPPGPPDRRSPLPPAPSPAASVGGGSGSRRPKGTEHERRDRDAEPGRGVGGSSLPPRRGSREPTRGAPSG